MVVEREEMNFDVLFVGGGPANLSCAIHLMNLINKHNKRIKQGIEKGNIIETEDKIAIIEKGSYIGAHGFSGAVMDPIAINELMPDFLDRGFPYEAIVNQEEIYWLSTNKAIKFPFIPKAFKNHGYYIISLSKVSAWLARIAEEMGIVILPGYSGMKVLYDNDRVTGVQTDDRDIDNNGIPQTPGYNLFSKVTVLGEGPKGTLTKQIIGKYNLDNSKNVPTYELGCKEIWELPDGRVEKGKVVHSLGFPLNKSKPGGGFIYHLSNNRLALGMVTYLSSKDPFLDTHRELQNWKNHIYINSLLKGGKCIYYGAKAIPSGGYYSIPKLTANGVMILGDSANLLNSKRLKGIHLAMKSGVLAAEAIFDGLKKDDLSEKQLSNYEYKFSDSWAKKELYKVRNFSQSMVKGFPFPAIFYVGFQTITYGNGILGRMKGESNHKSTQSIEQFYGKKVNPPENVKSDSNLIIDKLSDVFLSNTTHNEKQVSHITINNPSICKEKCYSQFGSPCTNYCPANVYEVVKTEEGGINIKVNFANCVHCKAADMKCPFDNITWMPPVGGDGPKYTIL